MVSAVIYTEEYGSDNCNRNHAPNKAPMIYEVVFAFTMVNTVIMLALVIILHVGCQGL